MENINLIRRIAWSFNATTGIDFDELLGEATLAYYEAKRTHNPKQSKLTTWAYNHIQNRLINFCKIQHIHSNVDNLIDHPYTNATPFFELAELFSDTALQIVNRITAQPEAYIGSSAKSVRGRIVKELRAEGWSWPAIWRTMDEIKTVLANN